MPGLAVVMGATLQCTTGAAPSQLVVDPLPVIAGDMPVATIIDGVGGVNILPFGVCELIGECFPATVAWIPEDPTMLIDFIPIVTQACICPCLIGAAVEAVTDTEEAGLGTVFVVDPGNFTVLIA